MNKHLLARRQIFAQMTALIFLASGAHGATANTARSASPRVDTKIDARPHSASTSTRIHVIHPRVKARIDHSINRYAVGAQTLTGGRGVPINLNRMAGSRGDIKPRIEHLVLAGKDEKARNADPKSPDTKSDAKSEKKAKAGGGKDGNGYNGANGDSGGGGTQLGAINSTPNNIPPATADQAKAFWNIVRSDFKHWDVVPDGRLTLPEIKHGLSSHSVKSDKAAALAALLITMKDGSHRSAEATSKYWSKDGLHRLVDAAIASKKSRLINRFAEQQEALQQKQPSRLSLFKPDGKPALEDIRIGASDNSEFVTAAAALAQLKPEAISSMINAGKNEAFTVKFPSAPAEQFQMTDGEVAQFASTGRNVLWIDVLQQAHEQLAEQAGDRHAKNLLTADNAKAADVIALLTSHDTTAIDLSKATVDQLQAAIADATTDKRLLLLSSRNSHHAAIVAYDNTKDAAEVFEPQCTVENPTAAIKSTNSKSKDALQTRWVSLAKLSEQFTKLTVETDKPSRGSYQDIIAKENAANASSSPNAKSEDAALWELAYAGLNAGVLENAKGSGAIGANNAARTLQVKLERGSALIAHENRVQVNAGTCNVRIAPNAAAYILKNDTATAVYNISDLHAGQVSIRMPEGSKEFVVSVGQALLISNDAKTSFDDATPDKAIATRDVVPLGVVNGKAIYRAEFSFTSLLDNAAGFEDLVNSDKAGDLRTVKRLIKTAAIMVTLRPAFGGNPEASARDSKNGGNNTQIETMNNTKPAASPPGTKPDTTSGTADVTATGPIAKP